MYRRLIILSVIILTALCGLVWLGYHSIQIWAQGLQGTRLGEFAEVAEHIRKDVKRKLDDFILAEQNRPYTDYQYLYVPEDALLRQQVQVVRSPLAGQLENSLAYGNFQIESDGTIRTPNDGLQQAGAVVSDELRAEVKRYKQNIKQNLLPVLGAVMPGSPGLNLDEKFEALLKAQAKESARTQLARNTKFQNESGKGKTVQSDRGKNLPIESLQNPDHRTQVLRQRRSIYEQNIYTNTAPQATEPNTPAPLEARQRPANQPVSQSPPIQTTDNNTPATPQPLPQGQPPIQQSTPQSNRPARESQGPQNQTVQVRIEPFVPIVTGGADTEQSIFNGQVFLVRHVQIEDRHFLQGFKLNEKRLIEEVKESASRFMREGMSFELPQIKNKPAESRNIAYSAILDFGFGNLILNLKEIDPARISNKINWLRNWYLGTITVVLLAVTLGLASLWRNARAQLKLAQKKDDFISAVSHELRTPLTSIRMYSEMLENNWVKSQDKRTEYYRNMRAESERLSRLIENVLDFSRIQRGRKKYTFRTGDINRCVAEVVETMRPYAKQNGFSIKMELGPLGQTAFDHDAVTQIMVNLLDNAIKYARLTRDKTITVRTRYDNQFILVEVEDHGPGIPLRQRKKIFEEFYRCGAEATRETAGTGLGLALVKKFALAHNGFVQIASAKPTGAIFRVALACQQK